MKRLGLLLAVLAGCSATDELTTATGTVSVYPPGQSPSSWAICEGSTDCAWQPTGSSPLPPRVSACLGGTLPAGVAEIHSGTGRCARLTGPLATDAQPMGYRFDTDFVTDAGWLSSPGNANDYMTYFTGPEHVASLTLGAGSHAMICNGSLRDSPTPYCLGTANLYSGRATQQVPMVPSGFTVSSIALAQNAPTPPLCPYVTGPFQPPFDVQQCGSIAADGLPRVRANAFQDPTHAIVMPPNDTPCVCPKGGPILADSECVKTCP